MTSTKSLTRRLITPCSLVVTLTFACGCQTAMNRPHEKGALATDERRAADRREITGRAIASDGDTIRINGTRIRIYGVDAPERDQTCTDGVGKPYDCGQKAKRELAAKLGQRTVRCDVVTIDHYRRPVARCGVGESDVGAWLVSSGLAMAYRYYSTDYVNEEEAARNARRGIWAGSLQPPWEIRHAKPGASAAGGENSDDPACDIKGNISTGSNKRIYHLPSDQWYGKTVITASKGERWFCNEAEAQAAGWAHAQP